jgi:hypothetical protein
VRKCQTSLDCGAAQRLGRRLPPNAGVRPHYATGRLSVRRLARIRADSSSNYVESGELARGRSLPDFFPTDVPAQLCFHSGQQFVDRAARSFDNELYPAVGQIANQADDRELGGDRAGGIAKSNALDMPGVEDLASLSLTGANIA